MKCHDVPFSNKSIKKMKALLVNDQDHLSFNICCSVINKLSQWFVFAVFSLTTGLYLFQAVSGKTNGNNMDLKL